MRVLVSEKMKKAMDANEQYKAFMEAALKEDPTRLCKNWFREVADEWADNVLRASR